MLEGDIDCGICLLDFVGGLERYGGPPPGRLRNTTSVFRRARCSSMRAKGGEVSEDEIDSVLRRRTVLNCDA